MLNNILKEGLTWDNDVCTDRAKALVGKTVGVISQIKSMAKTVVIVTAFFIIKHWL